jgi:integrase/recombinase XerD
MKSNNLGNLAKYIELFFVDYLINQKSVSTHTVASYRDTFSLLLAFIQTNLGQMPDTLDIEFIDSEMIVKFLNYLEVERGVTARTRNQRLAGLRSFYRYLNIKCPHLSHHIQQILAIPQKRYEPALITFLDETEIDALLNSPDQSTPMGRRDFTLILFLLQTGLRVSEIVSVKCSDVKLSSTSYVTCLGKGRKKRSTPLTKRTAKILKKWLSEHVIEGDKFIFQNARGEQFSVDGIQYLLTKYTQAASKSCPSLGRKKVSPHVIRHTTAMNLLSAGVDIMTIALWLGHESIETTKLYLAADMKMKEEALKKVNPTNKSNFRYKPNNKILRFLESL